MTKKTEGFIPIKRSLFNSFLFKEDRCFSRFEAWLDLIQMATFQEENTQLVKGKMISCARGQLVASIRFLEERWGWSRHKVADYLELLRSQEMLVVDNVSGVNRLTLLNFNKHNQRDSIRDSETHYSKGLEHKQGETKGTVTDTTSRKKGDSKRDSEQDSETRDSKGFDQIDETIEGTVKGTEKGQKRDKYNKDNKENNLLERQSEALPPPPKKGIEEKQKEMEARQAQFYDQLIPYVDRYGKQMIRAFYNYWSEPTKSKIKFKQEMEVTWDLRRRLEKWESNEYKYNKGLKPNEPIKQPNTTNERLKAAAKQAQQQAGH